MPRQSAPDPAPDVFHDVPALSTDDLRHNAVQQRDERNVLILADLEAGLSYRSIAAKHGVELTVVARLAAKMKVHRGAARNYMIAKALEVAEDWLDASKEAAKKGDHRPAKDWLLHAEEITPLAESPKTGIVINVGNGSSPTRDVNQVPTITVQAVENKALTDEP